MDVKKSIDGLLNKDVDRREFLAQVGAGVLAIAGIGSVIKSMSRSGRSAGYGSRDYGSKREG